MGRAPDFPIIHRAGSVVVRIYRQERPAERGRESRAFYALSWHDAGGVRRIRQFADLEVARAEARLKAEALAAGRSEAASALSMDDVALLAELRRVAGAIQPLHALQEWAKARELCGDNLLSAAQSWANSKRAKTAATVAQAVQGFLTLKKQAGVAMKSYNAYLAPLAEEMGDAPLAGLSAAMLTSWAHERFGDEETEVAHPGTFNTVRRRLVTCWKWARDSGLLPDTVKTQADLIEPMRESAHKIGILSVPVFAQVLALMRGKHPDYLAVAALAGFAGLRRAELHAQTWEDIDLKRGLLRVTRAKRGTVAYRLVHLCPAAVAWLHLAQRPEKTAEGTLVSPSWGVDRMRSYAREAKLDLPENAFRHSFVSYRCAATGNVAETAQEAGNSASVVHRHYRELVAKEDGFAWFALTPETISASGEIIPLAQPSQAKKRAVKA
jgi:integrase